MLSMKGRLDRLEQWANAQDAKDRARARAQSTRWHIAKVLLGTVFLIKAGVLATHATGPWQYAVAALMLLSAVMLMMQGIEMVNERLAPRLEELWLKLIAGSCRRLE
jgi:hypothetical protein